VVFLASFVFGLLIHIFSDYISSQVHDQVSGARNVDKENNTGIELQKTNNALTVMDAENISITLDSREENSAVAVSNETEKGLLDFRGVHSLAWNVIIGDFFHNFFDGVMISLAFSLCSKSYGWTVLGAIIAHEAPQEIADFMILLSAGMTVSQATLFNFLSALSALLGVIVTLAAVHDRDDINYVGLGYLLVINSGIFTYVGAVEMVPQFLDHNHGHKNTTETIKKSLALVLFFILGTVVIGSTMLAPHLHLCSAPGEEDDHHGHGH
jgi:zinc transporter ZupT